MRTISPSPVTPSFFRRPRSTSSPLFHHHPSLSFHHHSSSSSRFHPLRHHSSSSPFHPSSSSSSSFSSFAPKALSFSSVPGPFSTAEFYSGFVNLVRRSNNFPLWCFLFATGVLVRLSTTLEDQFTWVEPFLISAYPLWVISVIHWFAPAINLPYLKSVTVIAIVFAFWLILQLKSRWFSSKIASLAHSRNQQREIVLRRETLTSVVIITIGFALILQVFGLTGQDIAKYGGLGAAAAAYASKDIIGNIFGGLCLHFSKPFSPGETIKVGSYEGEVLRIGLTTTTLLDLASKDEISISNTEIVSTNVIVNRSRPQWRGKLAFSIPLNLNKIPLVKIPLISMDVIDSLKGNSQICLEEDIPSCYLCNKESELKITCKIKLMSSKEEFDFAKQQIHLDIVKIMKKHGV